MAIYKVVNTDKLNADLKTIADAIRTKGGTTEELVFPAGFTTAVEGIKVGGDVDTSSKSTKSINFRDYDGTLLYSYTKDEALALTSMPDLPTQPGLICQGWNYSLDNMQSYVAKYGACDIGAIYITDDGKTRLYIKLTEGRTSPVIGLCPNGTVTIDWGDGTTPDTLTGTSTSSVKWTSNHNYPAPGEYIITLTVSGSMGFYGKKDAQYGSAILRYSQNTDYRNYVYRSSLQKIELGSGITSIDGYAFYYCYALSNITIPEGVTNIGDSAFQSCACLSNIVIPESITSIGVNVFNGCYSLSHITIPESVTSIGQNAFASCYVLANIDMPESVTRIGNGAFGYCYSLSQITIPEGVTRIGSSMFSNCYTLVNIDIPEGVTSFGSSVFNYCYSLPHITIPEGVTSIDSSTFFNCKSLRNIIIPEGVTSIGSNAFSSCASLLNIIIPEGVTSISDSTFSNCHALVNIDIPEGVTSIGNSAFYACNCLANINIPENVTSIGSQAFYNCRSLASITLNSTTPPVLSATSAFSSIAADCVFYVPNEALAEYQTATNWSSFADQMQGY